MKLRNFFSSIRFQIIMLYLAVTLAAFVAISVTVSRVVENFLVQERVADQLTETERLVLELSPYLEDGSAEEVFAFLAQRASEMDGRVLLLDQDAVVQADSASRLNGYRLPYREVRDVLLGYSLSSYGFHKVSTADAYDNGIPFTSSTRWVVYYTAAITVDGVMQGAVLYSTSIQDTVDSVDSIVSQIALLCVIFALVLTLVNLIVSGWLTKPINALTNAIRQVSARGYSQRVNLRGRGEIAQLGEAFNTMSEQIENHDRMRDEFVSNASHELKTPLATMKLLAETMLYQEELDPAMCKEFFEDINHEIDRLTHVINDLLRLVQEERQDMELEKKSVQLDVLVQRVIDRLMPIAKQRGIRLERKLAPVTIQADEMRIDQVVTNLVDNGLKYTDKGSVAVSLKADGGYAVLTVRDTGIGIPKEAIPRLFERFYRVDKARSRSTGGTGLGLSIVERIVSMHDGFIHVDSAVGKGTTFTVRLPINPAAKLPEAEKEGKRK